MTFLASEQQRGKPCNCQEMIGGAPVASLQSLND